MRKELNWRDKYALALKESLTINEIMQLRDCGKPKAAKIREKGIQYCVANNIEFDLRKTSTQIVFTVTGLDLDYYYQKMLLERKIIGEEEDGNL